MNGGDYPIDNVVLVVADPGAEYVDLAQQQGTAVQRVLGTMLPKETQESAVEVTFTSDPVFGQCNSMAQVLFLDTWNESCARGPMVLERMEAPLASAEPLARIDRVFKRRARAGVVVAPSTDLP